MVLERFAEEPGVAVELVRAALAQAATAAGGGADSAAPMAEDGAADGSGATAAEAAEALALEVAADDRLLESMMGEEPALRRQLASLLYNHAVLCLHAGRGRTAGLSFFSATLPLLGGGSQGQGEGEGEGPHPVECHRAQALCAMAASQHDRWGRMGRLLLLPALAVVH